MYCSSESAFTHSSDSSICQRQSCKGPHTIRACSNFESIPDTASTYCIHCHNNEKSASSRDVIISMLREQLQKLEELYKKHLDEYQELRYKYYTSVQECCNLKKICEQIGENRASANKCNFESNKNEAHEWKLQCEVLSKRIIQLEDEIKKLQSLIADKENYLCDTSAIEGHCKYMEDILRDHSEKLQMLLKTSQVKKNENSEENICTHPHFEEQTDVKLTKSELSNYCKIHKDAFLQYCENCMKDLQTEINTLQEKSEQLSHLEQEMTGLRTENVILRKRLGNVSTAVDIKLSKDQSISEDISSYDYQEMLQDASQNFDQATVSVSEQSNKPVYSLMEKFLSIKDSIIENLKKENQNLKMELSTYRIKTQDELPEEIKIVEKDKRVSFSVKKLEAARALKLLLDSSASSVTSASQDRLRESVGEQQIRNTEYSYDESYSNQPEYVQLQEDLRNMEMLHMLEMKDQQDKYNQLLAEYNSLKEEQNKLSFSPYSSERKPKIYIKEINDVECGTQDNQLLNQELQKLNSTLQELQGEIDNKTVELLEYQKRMEMNQRAFTEISEQYKQLQQDYDSLQQQYSNQVLKTEKLESDCDRLKTIVEEQEDAISFLEDKLQNQVGNENSRRTEELQNELLLKKDQMREVMRANEMLREQIAAKGKGASRESKEKMQQLKMLVEQILKDNKDLRLNMSKCVDDLEEKLQEHTRKSASSRDLCRSFCAATKSSSVCHLLVNVPPCSRQNELPDVLPIFISKERQPGSLLGSGSPTKRTSSKSLPDLNSCLINEKKCNPANVQILYSSTKDKTGKDSTTKRACSLDRKETESQVKKMSKVKCSKRGTCKANCKQHTRNLPMPICQKKDGISELERRLKSKYPGVINKADSTDKATGTEVQMNSSLNDRIIGKKSIVNNS